MLINADVKGLEVVTAAFLSKDKILCKEILDGVDIHGENQKAFHLPSRLIAKKFKFRLIYGGTAYAFSVDPEFSSVGFSVKRWEKVVDDYYSKYRGVKEWQDANIRTAISERQLIGPTGRIWKFDPVVRHGVMEWPVTTIKNYPVQGTGADLVMVARISLFRRMREAGLTSLLISSVHDSIVADCPDNEYEAVGKLMKVCVENIPNNFERLFGIPFNLPITCELMYGKNMADMKEMKI
jgi:DNA polymerase-1